MGGQFQIPGALAYGRYGNFFARSDNIFTEGDATPDVTQGCLFFSNNTSTTVITHFDLQPPPGDTSATYHQMYEGKSIRVVFLDGSTGLANAGRLVLASSDNLQGANNSIELLYHNSAWIEFSRSYNNPKIVTIESKNLTGSVLSLGTGAVSVAGNVSVIRIIAGANSAAVLHRAINGAQGQVITLIASAASDALIIVNSASSVDGTFVTTTTTSTPTQFRLMSSGAISFVKQGNQWLEIRPVSGNSSGQLQ